jgi:hypothetical protein
MNSIPLRFILFLLVFLSIVGIGQNGSAKEEAHTILIELFLSSDKKENLEQIKSELSKIEGVRVKAQFYPKGNAPLNIAIGKGVSASAARLAIQIAKQYNGGVQYILPDFLYPLGYIAIGGSHFSEELHVPIHPDDLSALSDPDKTTEEWHRLYQTLIARHPRFHEKSRRNKE